MMSYISRPSQGITYTRIWVNDSPTTSRSGFTATLSRAVTDFDALRIVYKYKTNSSVTEDNWQDSSLAIAYLYDIRGKRDAIVSGQQHPRMGITFYAQAYVYVRTAYFSGDDKVYFTTCYRSNAEGSDNTLAIPLFIDGVNLN